MVTHTDVLRLVAPSAERSAGEAELQSTQLAQATAGRVAAAAAAAAAQKERGAAGGEAVEAMEGGPSEVA